MTGPEMKRFTETVINMLPNIDWTFEGGGECPNMIASAFIYDQFRVRIWWNNAWNPGQQCGAQLRYCKTSIFEVLDDSQGFSSVGVPLDTACLGLKAKLTEIVKAFEIAAGPKPSQISLGTIELVAGAKARLITYYGKEKVVKHFQGLSSDALAELLPFIAAHTDEQLENVCQYSLEALSMLALPYKVTTKALDIGGIGKIHGYVTRTPKELWQPAPDKVPQLNFMLLVDLMKFFLGSALGDEIKQAQSKLDVFDCPVPLMFAGKRMAYLECIDLDTLFQISRSRAINDPDLTRTELVEKIKMQNTAKELIQSELSKEYGSLFPWDLKVKNEN